MAAKSLSVVLFLAIASGEAGQSPDAAWKKIEPFAQPPAEFAGKLGSYKSPLEFADGSIAKTPADWTRRRAEILKTWQERLGPWPPLVEKPVLKKLETVERDGYTEHRVQVQASPEGRWVDGYLLVPKGPGPFPAVVVPFYEPLTSIGRGNKGRGVGTHDYGLQLVKRGFVTLSIGTPGSLDKLGGDTREALIGVGKDFRRQPLTLLAYVAANCLTALAQMSEVDATRIGIIGLSYGGKWSMFASCLDERFACAVWSDPGIVFNEKDSNVNYWEPWYLGFDPKTQRKSGIPSEKNPRTGLYKELIDAGNDLVDLHALMAPRPVMVGGGVQDPPKNWIALNHLIEVNKVLGHKNRAFLTARPTHPPTPEALEQELAFLEYFLKHAPRDKQEKGNRQESRKKAEKTLRHAFQELTFADLESLPYRAIEDIAVLQAKLGLTEESKKAFTTARQMIDGRRASDMRFWDYRELARAHGRAGDSAAVIEVVSSIPDKVPNYRGEPKEFRAMVLRETLFDMIKAGFPVEASRILDRFQDTKNADSLREWIAHDIVMQQANAGQLADARRAVEDLKSPTWQIRALLGTFILNESYGENPTHPGIAVLQAERGQREEAEKSITRAVAIFEQIPADKRDRYKASLVSVQARLGELDAARNTLGGISDPAFRKNATAMFIRALGAKGRVKEAEDLVVSQTDSSWMVYLLMHFSMGLATGGDSKGARATIDKGIPLLLQLKEEDRHLLVHNFASAQAKVGDADGAVQTLQLLRGESSVGRSNIAYSLASAGAYDRALKIADGMNDGEWWTGNVYRSIAHLQTAKGDEVGVAAWINRLRSSHSRGNALLGMAEGLVERAK